MTLQERFDDLNAKLDTAGSALAETGAKLTEATAEILAELTKLREGGNLNADQEASLSAIEAKVAAVNDAAASVDTTAKALADVSPPVA